MKKLLGGGFLIAAFLAALIFGPMLMQIPAPDQDTHASLGLDTGKTRPFPATMQQVPPTGVVKIYEPPATTTTTAGTPTDPVRKSKISLAQAAGYPAVSPPGPVGAQFGGDGVSEAVAPGVASSTWASYDETDPLTVRVGTKIPCTTDAVINSQKLGTIVCHLAQASGIRGGKGLIDLIDPGATFVGEAQGGAISPGQNRVSVIITEGQNPDGVRFGVLGEGAGPLGALGVEGDLRIHFVENLARATLTGFIDFAPYLLAAGLQNNHGGEGSNNTNITQFVAPQQSVARSAFPALPPEVNIPINGQIEIIVKRPINFSKVYGTRLIAAGYARR